MIADYDDDTHFCLKCHATILGLDNYVAHRKAGCSKNLPTVEDPPKSPLPSQLLPQDETFSLIADDFFSSLELQSSAKKATTATTTTATAIRNFSGVLTRSKTSAVIQATNPHKETPQESPPKPDKHDWLGGPQFKTVGGSDNQTKLLKTVDNLSRPISRKEEPQTIEVYDDSEESSEEYESEEESEDEEPPRHFTGGKWKPSSSPVQWTEGRGWGIPPPTYTGGKWNPSVGKHVRQSPPLKGGKWKPSSPPPAHTYTGGKWSHKAEYREIPPPTNTKGKWKPINPDEREEEIPPPEHTKGKWKPVVDNPVVREETVVCEVSGRKSREEDDYSPKWENKVPSPSYTKGKWKPSSSLEEQKPTTSSQLAKPNKTNKYKSPIEVSPFRKSGGRIQYWCGPCNRRLASKVVYERHLKSELHFKRKLRERELDDTLEPIKFPCEGGAKKARLQTSSPPPAQTNKGRARKKLFIKCDVCHSRVNSKLIGKHLISHYHCRRGDTSQPEAQKMILEYVHEVILQSPFQCNCCKFYCNTQTEFLAHWKSSQHSSQSAKTSGYFKCTFCKFDTFSNDVMFSHLISNEHSEVLSVINRSVPVVIAKVNPLVCPTCDEQFLLNVQLRSHCRTYNHEYPKKYQDEHSCKRCHKTFKSSVSFNRHQRKKHKESVYECTFCSLSFATTSEAQAHRKTTEHRYMVLSKKNKGDEGPLRKSCEYCPQSFENFLQLKKHLKENHSEFRSRCPHCGTTFPVPQDLTVHIRSKSCTYPSPKQAKHTCVQCQFTSNSTSDFLFHKVLHTEPLLTYSTSASQKPTPQYKCPVCGKLYSKPSLQCHIRIHTKERPYVCSLCGAGFVRKNNWALHVKNHREGGDKKRKRSEAEVSGERPYLCSACGASFKRKFVLHQHMSVHTGKECKCPKPGCIFTARSLGELNEHFQTHSDAKTFKCDLCDYKGNTKRQLVRHQTIHTEEKKYKCSVCAFTARFSGHLKRHERTHTGAKPFGCPHCPYRCNTLENLRKHVLSTNKHPGKCIYECKFCPDNNRFQTNLAKDLKVHLVDKHADVFQSSVAAASYVAGIYETNLQQNDTEGEIVLDIHEESELQCEIEEEGTTSQMRTFEDPVVASSTSAVLLPFSKHDKNQEELFPMFIVAKDEVVAVDSTSDAWSMIGSYDAESGVLIPFNADGETLFQEF